MYDFGHIQQYSKTRKENSKTQPKNWIENEKVQNGVDKEMKKIYGNLHQVTNRLRRSSCSQARWMAARAMCPPFVVVAFHTDSNGKHEWSWYFHKLTRVQRNRRIQMKNEITTKNQLFPSSFTHCCILYARCDRLSSENSALLIHSLHCVLMNVSGPAAATTKERANSTRRRKNN